MSGLRQAAAAIYGLHEDDQRWILQELSGGDREKVVTYLGELRELGFTRDQVTASNAPLRDAPVSPAAASADERLSKAAPDQMRSVLRDESPSLIAQVLAMRDWSWAAEFLETLEIGQREQILRARKTISGVAPARKDVLLAVIARRIEACPGVSAHQGGTSNERHAVRKMTPIAQIRNWFASWKR